MSISKLSWFCVWRSLGLTDDLADGIIEFAKAGERNPDFLCEAALKKLHEHFVQRLARK
jgi:hypothetical protein